MKSFRKSIFSRLQRLYIRNRYFAQIFKTFAGHFSKKQEMPGNNKLPTANKQKHLKNGWKFPNNKSKKFFTIIVLSARHLSAMQENVFIKLL